MNQKKEFIPSFLKSKQKELEKDSIVETQGKVILNKKVYRTIIASSVRFANSQIPESDWAEVYGILIGHIENGNILVSEAYPITHTMKKGHILKVSYDSEDYVHSVSFEEESYKHDPPEFIVGWYHSHPGIKLMFSQDDIKNQLFWQQANPYAIGPVFNHVRLIKQSEISIKKDDAEIPLINDPGFLIFRLKDPSKGLQSEYVQVPYEFSDAKIDEEFIEEAKYFVKSVTRLFPRENFYEKSKQNLEKELNKLEDIYSGTSSYITTLIREGKLDKIRNIVLSQYDELVKMIDSIDSDILLLKELVNYVEYKERESIIPKMQELFEYWSDKKQEFLSKFQELKEKYK